MQECSALLEFLLCTTMQVLKLSKVHFVEDPACVFLDLVFDLVVHVGSVSP